MFNLKKNARHFPDIEPADINSTCSSHNMVIAKLVKIRLRAYFSKRLSQESLVLILARYKSFVLLQFPDFYEQTLIIAVIEKLLLMLRHHISRQYVLRQLVFVRQ